MGQPNLSSSVVMVGGRENERSAIDSGINHYEEITGRGDSAEQRLFAISRLFAHLFPFFTAQFVLFTIKKNISKKYTSTYSGG